MFMCFVNQESVINFDLTWKQCFLIVCMYVLSRTQLFNMCELLITKTLSIATHIINNTQHNYDSDTTLSIYDIILTGVFSSKST
jgi:hypothetical protein